MIRRSVYAILSLGVVLAVLIAFPPHLRYVVWTGIVWVILAVSVIVVVGVAVNILSVIWSMYSGYRPAAEEPVATSARPPGELLPFAQPNRDSEPAVRVNRAEDVLVELCRAERALSNLESSFGFQALTEKQKHHYSQALGEVHALIQEVSKESSHEKVAS
jgi:hypothetical protein